MCCVALHPHAPPAYSSPRHGIWHTTVASVAFFLLHLCDNCRERSPEHTVRILSLEFERMDIVYCLVRKKMRPKYRLGS